MITLIRPLLFKFLQSDRVKGLIVEMLEKLAETTDNDIDDYAPTWQCGTNHVVFTSDVNGNPDIFDADPLPISAPAM